MKNLKLTIDLLPRGAWDKNLSKVLPKKEWDAIRHAVYDIADNKCTICANDGELHAHEVWHFDIPTKTQTLTDIIALCVPCHGVKHMRHSQRIGYGNHAKRHFMKINNCSLSDFAEHFLQAESLFNERSTVEEWHIKIPDEITRR